MKNWIISNKLYIIGAVLGAITGFFYWQQVGCLTGTCPITSKPFNSIIYGAILGTLILGLFKREKNVKNV